MKEIVVDHTNKKKRLDKFLITFFNGCSKNLVYKFLRKKTIKVNNKKKDFRYILKEGDRLQIYISDESLEKIRNPKKTLVNTSEYFLNVIYEDSEIIIVNKPKGIIIHSDNKEKFWILQDFVIAYCIETGQYDNTNNTSYKPSPVHRIDRNTEGLVIFAKTYQSFNFLTDLIKKRLITKKYLTIVHGQIINSKKVEIRLEKNTTKNQVFISKNGKKAITHINPIISNRNYSLIEIELITGRTHQIRKTLSHIGHPILGEAKYSKVNDNKEFSLKNQLLLAYSIEFPEIKNKEFEELSKKMFQTTNSKELNRICELLFNEKISNILKKRVDKK